MNRTNIINEIKTIIKAEGKYELNDKDLDQSFQNGLGLDSLTRIKMIVEIEKTFDIEIEEGAVTRIDTVNQLAQFIEERIHGNVPQNQ
jgi:acyl carrier protein